MVWVLSRLKRVLFAIQCGNIIHTRQLMLRHLMLYKTALGEGRVLYRLLFLTFPVTPVFPAPMDILSSDWHWADHVQVQALSGWEPRTPLQAPARHHENVQRKSLSLHSDSFLPHGDIRHSPDSEVTALSPAMSVLSHIYWSLPRDNDVLGICMECASQYVVFHFISWFYHPFPITDQALGLRNKERTSLFFFPSWIRSHGHLPCDYP